MNKNLNIYAKGIMSVSDKSDIFKYYSNFFYYSCCVGLDSKQIPIEVMVAEALKEICNTLSWLPILL